MRSRLDTTRCRSVALAGIAFVIVACVKDSYDSDSTTPTTGWFATAIGDVDGDGFGDLAISLRFDPVTEADDFATWVVSGRDAKPLFRVRTECARQPARRTSEFGRHVPDGHRVSSRGDENGDGLPDIGIGCGWTDRSNCERIVLISGKDGFVVGERLEEFRLSPMSGVRPLRTQDVDRDGYDDYVDNAPSRSRRSVEHSRRSVEVELLSGKTIDRMAVAHIDPRCQFVREYQIAGDVSGDHIPDIALTGDVDLVAETSERWKPAYGVVTLHSGTDGALLRTIDRDTLRQWSTLGVPLVVIR